jgi:hypothetical protein
MKIQYKVTITQLDSKGIEKIIDSTIVETRKEAEDFIKKNNAIPREYKPTAKKPICFYELSA